MSDERRYNEHEIAAIFKQAAEAQDAAQRQLAHSEGLTLAELQQIGREAGITPAFIARAAVAADRTDSVLPPRTYLGVSISAARTVDLPRPLSDENWDRLVADMRKTFQATGEVRRDGSLRQWRNGNLHALIEPTDSGRCLHLRTLKGNAQTALTGALSFFVMGLALTLMVVLTGEAALDSGTLIAALFALAGLGTMGITVHQLSRWRAERERQMEAIAARTVERVSASSAGAPRESASSRDLGPPEEPAKNTAQAARTQRRNRA